MGCLCGVTSLPELQSFFVLFATVSCRVRSVPWRAVAAGGSVGVGVVVAIGKEGMTHPMGIFESLLHKNVQRNYLAYVFNCNLYVLPAPQRVKLDVEDVKTEKCDQPPLPP